MREIALYAKRYCSHKIWVYRLKLFIVTFNIKFPDTEHIAKILSIVQYNIFISPGLHTALTRFMMIFPTICLPSDLEFSGIVHM